jgi:hypothetical protein
LNPTEAAEEKAGKFLAANKSRALKRFTELSQQSLAASAAATKMEDLTKAGSDVFIGGVEADLAELCIGAKQKQ